MKSKKHEKIELMQGNEACAEAAIASGLEFYAGYPITPSTEIMEILARRLPNTGGTFIQMEDEIASLAAVLGASLSGVKSMTATSGPGFSLMQENIGFGVIAEIPAVIVNVQRLGPSTGGPTKTAQGDIMQAKWGGHGDYDIIALSPSNVEECYTLTIAAFNFAEQFRVPVILLLEEVIGHLRESVVLPEKDTINIINRKSSPEAAPRNYQPYEASINEVPVIANFGEGYRYHVTGLVHDKTGFPATENHQEVEKLRLRLREKIVSHQEEITMFKEWETEDADSLIITYGSAERSALAALRDARIEGSKVGLLSLKTIWPFPHSLVHNKCENKKYIMVPEHNFGQIAGEVSKNIDAPTKVIPICHVDGTMIKPEYIKAYIKE